MYKLGIDLGGSKTEAILLDENLNIIQRKRIPTPKNDYSQILDTITSLSSDLLVNVEDFSIGICSPGTISKKTGLIKIVILNVLLENHLKKI